MSNVRSDTGVYAPEQIGKRRKLNGNRKIGRSWRKWIQMGQQCTIVTVGKFVEAIIDGAGTV